MNDFSIIKIGFLNRFYLTYDEVEIDFSENCLIIELIDKNECSRIKFKNISMLKIKSLSSMHRMVIASCDIRFQQLENINFQIMEIEEDAISFYCESFEVV